MYTVTKGSAHYGDDHGDNQAKQGDIDQGSNDAQSGAQRKSNSAGYHAPQQAPVRYFVLYTKTLNYHWNITGPEFISLHLLLEDQYDDLAESIDLIAERVRKMGGVRLRHARRVQAEFRHRGTAGSRSQLAGNASNAWSMTTKPSFANCATMPKPPTSSAIPSPTIS